ncbi:MAG TPA: baseplate J/gp47 family protein [Polyangiaceae bacterium]|nr:baseplate J/gp47 family protein [Polyangiaceae bacterium]
MALSTPTTADLRDNIVAQLSASLSQTIPLLPKAFAYVLATVLAGVFILLYKYCGFIFLQMFVQYATDAEVMVNGKVVRPLVLWGEFFGVGDPELATRAEATARVSVLSQTGSLPGGAQLLNASTGVLYQTTAPVPLNAPVVFPTIRAMSDQTGGDGSGSIGNLNPGDVVSFANPLPNVGKDAVVVAQTVTGADAETVDAYRGRVLLRTRGRPQGGAYADYRIWASEVPGIVAIYPYASATPGEIDLYIEADEASSGSADGIPTAAQLSAVQAAIQFDAGGVSTRQPVNVSKVNVLPITRVALDAWVVGLVIANADRAACEAAIQAGCDEYFRSRESFTVGFSSLPRNDRATNAQLGALVDEIVSANNGTVESTQLYALPFPPVFALATNGPGTKVKLGVVHYI